jgi:hypothetical protein
MGGCDDAFAAASGGVASLPCDNVSGFLGVKRLSAHVSMMIGRRGNRRLLGDLQYPVWSAENATISSARRQQSSPQ